ncbi:MAG: holo-ACP synthase [Candidatus Nitricoxidivorans perseverans]|uniref:Holo-[acyl-carrier-protein] synthase n=1 Tax=Candidatus Nitricoxidivorans perseverans TaxID=2975601 RepID=A0AA49FMG3_9PROT|nr:MAG: holo-ACP synthase [Candidatus Nitricoxidivorans perseverans]
MIFGIGTDIVAVGRMAGLWERHGERAMDKILSPDERADCLASPEPARFLAKRFAAKEAFGKAMGTGMRSPVAMPSITVAHDELGKPFFRLAPELVKILAELSMVPHLSISDEHEHAVAFVILEKS